MRSFKNLGRRLFAIVGLLVAALLVAPVTASSAPMPSSAPAATQQVAAAPVASPAQVAAAAKMVVPAASAAFIVPSVIDASYCSGIWKAVWWARGCASDGNVVVQDIRQDGWCVEVKYRNRYGNWVRVPYSTSCYGKVVAVKVSTAYPVRIYRGNGNYFSLPWR